MFLGESKSTLFGLPKVDDGKEIMERGVQSPTRIVVFGQSQCSVSVGQSEQTVLVGRRDFVENEAFEGGGE